MDLLRETADVRGRPKISPSLPYPALPPEEPGRRGKRESFSPVVSVGRG